MIVAQVAPVVWRLGYLAIFGLAAAVCFAAMYRSTRIKDTRTRWGLLGLFVFGGGWASLLVLHLLAGSLLVRSVSVTVAIVAGLWALGAWLYLCSAYTRRSTHRNTSVRAVAILVLIGLTMVVLTNPFHGLLFTSTGIEVPFDHRGIRPTPWGIGLLLLAYSLAATGAVLLVRQFRSVAYDTTTLMGVLGVAGSPVVLDLASAVVPTILPFGYGPLGIPIFAVGALYRYLERFQIVQLTGHIDHPIVIVDSQGRVDHANWPADELFPGIATAHDEPLETFAPALASAVDGPDEILTLGGADGSQQYRVTTNPFATDTTHLGRMIALTEVRAERSGREQGTS